MMPRPPARRPGEPGDHRIRGPAGFAFWRGRCTVGEHFFKFPLPVLSLPWEPRVLLGALAGYCAVDVGRIELGRLPPEEIEQRLRTMRLPPDFNRNNADHVACALGSRTLHVTSGAVAGCVADYYAIQQEIEVVEQRLGRSPLIFIASDLLWETREGRGLPWREFSVLCAVNSVIGLARTAPIRITRDMIQARSIGYKRPADIEEAKKRQWPVQELLSTSQLRTTLDRLERRGFFVRISPSPRCTYFVRGTDYEAARAAVKALREKRRSLAAERAKDRALFGP